MEWKNTAHHAALEQAGLTHMKSTDVESLQHKMAGAPKLLAFHEYEKEEKSEYPNDRMSRAIERKRKIQKLAASVEAILDKANQEQAVAKQFQVKVALSSNLHRPSINRYIVTIHELKNP